MFYTVEKDMHGGAEMEIKDSVLKHRLQNVYFIWGRGKTTIANRLAQQYGWYVYSTDESRGRQIALADPTDQPYMCRDYEQEYGVNSFWELPPEVIADREQHVLAEMTPMMIAELIALSPLYDVILCEGDIDYAAVAPIATHAVHLCCCDASFDWFDRPDHEDIRALVADRTDLTEEEKQAVIDNAYAVVGTDCGIVPDWVNDLGIKNIMWNEHTGIDNTAAEVAVYFGFENGV